uniref:Uncharacterized protein n=1 Tax=Timema bartmani TaxID=61472 RepID=A0A7R9I8C6_9NEOP|nr:unnamed protein product [Timema bartmani]
MIFRNTDHENKAIGHGPRLKDSSGPQVANPNRTDGTIIMTRSLLRSLADTSYRMWVGLDKQQGVGVWKPPAVCRRTPNIKEQGKVIYVGIMLELYCRALVSTPVWHGDGDLEDSESDTDTEDKEDSEPQEEYGLELAELNSEINIKQKLIDELEQSQRRLHVMKQQYEDKLQQLMARIKNTQEERDKVLASYGGQNNQPTEKVRKVKDEYERKLTDMQKELKRLQSAQREHVKLLRNQSQHESQLRSLKSDLNEMKKSKHYININPPPLSITANINPPPLNITANINPPLLNITANINPPLLNITPNINPPPLNITANINPPPLNITANINPPPLNITANINPPPLNITPNINPLPLSNT